MKGNVIRLNIMHLNSVHLNSIGEVQSVSLKAGESTEDPVYPPTTYTLAANVSNGKVTATKNGTAISLPYVATEGDVIVLSVTPDEGYEFNGWLDGNKSNPRTVTMTGNVVLSASCVEIAKPTYTLSASVTNGKVSATLNGSAVNLPFTANEGDVVVVEVTPNDGYTFEGWADGNTDNPRSITMTADVVLSAQCVEVVVPSKYIQFEDAEVERVLMSKGVSSDGVGITIEDAERVTDIGTWFYNNTSIVSFNEFVYFSAVSKLIDRAFFNCKSLVSILIPNSVKTISTNAFYGCSVLSGIVTEAIKIDAYAFQNSGIRSFSAPMATTIGASLCNGCGNLEFAEFPMITSITEKCFLNCSNLSFFEIVASVNSIGTNAFYGCQKLQKVICRATTPPSLGGFAFNNTNNCPIYVPDASVEAYRTATNWVSFASRIKPLSEYNG